MVRKWWHDKVAYQIYPKSFCDSNGDGIGDLPGIISKLDYLKDLGVDILWVSPIYKSPFVDQGYDISDYYAIDPSFGTMDDFDRLIEETKKRDMHVLMDLVINHCSDQHPWFQKALQDPYGEYGKYFYFEKGKNGKAPSNYRSYFGGSTWEPVHGYDDLYYLHMFAKEQPDLNWTNPKLKNELFDMINWWLDKGLAGFRIDAIINVKKDTTFPSFPADGPDGLCHCTQMVKNVNGVGELLEELKENTFKKYDAFTIGEVFHMKPAEIAEFIGDDGHFSSMFDFRHLLPFRGKKGWYTAETWNFNTWRDNIFASQAETAGIGFKANIIENHDEPRGASRLLPEYAQNEAGIKMLGTVSVLLRGLPFLFQGQEIGMRNYRCKSVEDYNDVHTLGEYRKAIAAGCTEEEAFEACERCNRNNARTPMQWSAEENAGFTTGTPWLNVNPNYVQINVAAQDADADSVLNYYRKLIALRKDERFRETFTYGECIPAFKDEDMVMAYYRTNEEKNQQILVISNFGSISRTVSLPCGNWQLLLTNMGTQHNYEGEITLASCEVIVLLR